MQPTDTVDSILAVLDGEQILVYRADALLQHVIVDGETTDAVVAWLPIGPAVANSRK